MNQLHVQDGIKKLQITCTKNVKQNEEFSHYPRHTLRSPGDCVGQMFNS